MAVLTHPPRARLIGCSLTVLLAALAGCGDSFDRQRQLTLVEVEHHQYDQARGRIDQMYDCHEKGDPTTPHGSPADSDSLSAKQLLLWRMERGMVANLAGDLTESNHHLDAAAVLVDERRTKSLAGEVGTFLANDTLRAYAGHGYEHIQVDYYRIINHLVQAERSLGLLTSEGNVAASPGHDVADQNYDQAVTRARRMTLEELPETSDLADQHRYRDDPFARFLAGAVTWALPPATRREEDQEFAEVMFKRSMAAYANEEQALAGDKYFRWEVGQRPRLVERLFLRHTLAYDPGGFQDAARHFHLDADKGVALPKGDGMLLVLNHVGFVSRPRTLSIGFGTVAPELTSSDRAAGATSNTFMVGGLVFWAKGPGSEVVGAWVVPLPSEVMEHMTPGGIGIFGMELPVDDRERPIPQPGRVRLRPIQLADPARSDMVPFESSLEVVSDLDAYARATLKDEQPRLLAKTISRAVAKQLIAGEAADQAKKAGGALLGAVVDLVGSGAATLSEVADIRSWTTLPDHVEATLIDLPAGSYALELESEYGDQPLGTVKIPSGQLVIAPTRTFPEPTPEPR